MSDTFSSDEAQRIFARAARRQHAARAENGLSLDDLVAIGREAGLDPALVAAEAQAARHEDDAPDDGRRVRILPTDVTDGEWERIVDLLRAESGGPGVAQQIGRRREWSSSGPTMRGVPVESVCIEALGGQTRLTVTPRDLSSQKMLRWILPGLMLMNAALYGPLVAMEGRPGLGLGIAAGFVVLAAFLAWLIPVRLKSRARTTDERVEALLDRIDLASRADDARLGAPSDSATEAGRLDLGALPDAPGAESAPRTPSRLRQ